MEVIPAIGREHLMLRKQPASHCVARRDSPAAASYSRTPTLGCGQQEANNMHSRPRRRVRPVVPGLQIVFTKACRPVGRPAGRRRRNA